MRQDFIETGFPEAQIARITGKSNAEPAHDDVMDPANNRIEVILLR